MSSRRLNLFENCTKQNEEARYNNGINNTYEELMGDVMAAKVAGWLTKHGGIRTVRGLLTYNGMANAAKVMCRWPHPQEVARIAKSLSPRNSLPTIYCLQVKLRYEEGGDLYKKLSMFVGPLGSNFAQMGLDYGLMYVWLETDDETDTHTLYMYALKEDALYNALQQGENCVQQAANKLGITVDDEIVFPYILNTEVDKEFAVSHLPNGWPRVTVSRVSAADYTARRSNAQRALDKLVEPRKPKASKPLDPKAKPFVMPTAQANANARRLKLVTQQEKRQRNATVKERNARVE